MKSTGPNVLAALVVLIATAFAGVPSAMAEETTLCKTDESPCAEANQITHVHEASVKKIKLLTTFLTVECDILNLAEVLKHNKTLFVILKHATLTYTNCGACTLTEENGPTEIKVLKEGHETAKVTGEGLVHVVCGGSLDCSYNGVGLIGTAKGPLLSMQANGEVSLEKETTNKEPGGFLCPPSSRLDMTTAPLTANYFT